MLASIFLGMHITNTQQESAHAVHIYDTNRKAIYSALNFIFLRALQLLHTIKCKFSSPGISRKCVQSEPWLNLLLLEHGPLLAHGIPGPSVNSVPFLLHSPLSLTELLMEYNWLNSG